jgi:hypothetical protein
MLSSSTRKNENEISGVYTRYIPGLYLNDLEYMYLVYARYILGIYLEIKFGIYQVYTRYIPGLETCWYIPGITWYIPPISPMLVYTWYIPGIYLA